jgi:branched-chain amino acid transport system permease protein
MLLTFLPPLQHALPNAGTPLCLGGMMPRIGMQAVKGTITLALPLIALAVIAELILPAAFARLATLYLIYVTGVVGMQIYSGNSGIISFGHAGFMALGAYASALLTIQSAVVSTQPA